MDIEVILDEVDRSLDLLIDGEISDDDMNELFQRLDVIKRYIADGIQSMIDEPGERKNIMYAKAAVGAAKMAVFWKKLLS